MACEISVVLCTYNRAGMLEDSLQSWRGVEQAGVDVEFIVVDNVSTDATRAIVERFEPDFPCILRYVYEANPGLSFARNRGIAEAQGALVAFVDDDIYFDSRWLAEIVAAFRDHPEIHCVGGMSIPTFEIEKPEWLTESMLKFYGSTLSGESDRLMTFPEHPFGVNMAFRREVFVKVGGFNTDLGRIRTSLLSNEEKDIFHRIDAAGFKVFYASRAILQHRVPADRLQQDWLLRRAYWQGISNVIFDQYVRRRSRLGLSKNLLRNLKRMILGISTYFSGASFEDKIRAYGWLGVARQNFLELFRRSN